MQIHILRRQISHGVGVLLSLSRQQFMFASSYRMSSGLTLSTHRFRTEGERFRVVTVTDGSITLVFPAELSTTLVLGSVRPAATHRI